MVGKRARREKEDRIRGESGFLRGRGGYCFFDVRKWIYFCFIRKMFFNELKSILNL